MIELTAADLDRLERLAHWCRDEGFIFSRCIPCGENEAEVIRFTSPVFQAVLALAREGLRARERYPSEFSAWVECECGHPGCGHNDGVITSCNHYDDGKGCPCNQFRKAVPHE